MRVETLAELRRYLGAPLELEKLEEYIKKNEEAAKKNAEAWSAVNRPLLEANDSLQVTNDRLAN